MVIPGIIACAFKSTIVFFFFCGLLSFDEMECFFFQGECFFFFFVKHSKSWIESNRSCINIDSYWKNFYLCTMCNKAFPRVASLGNQLLSHCELSSLMCLFCDKVLKNKGSLKDHLLRHGNIKAHECTQCDRMFFSKKELRRHHVVHVNKKPHQCTFCEKQFKRRGVLKVHQAVQHEGLKRPRGKGNRNYVLCPCAICGKVFSSKGHAVRHF